MHKGWYVSSYVSRISDKKEAAEAPNAVQILAGRISLPNILIVRE